MYRANHVQIWNISPRVIDQHQGVTRRFNSTSPAVEIVTGWLFPEIFLWVGGDPRSEIQGDQASTSNFSSCKPLYRADTCRHEPDRSDFRDVPCPVNSNVVSQDLTSPYNSQVVLSREIFQQANSVRGPRRSRRGVVSAQRLQNGDRTRCSRRVGMAAVFYAGRHMP